MIFECELAQHTFLSYLCDVIFFFQKSHLILYNYVFEKCMKTLIILLSVTQFVTSAGHVFIISGSVPHVWTNLQEDYF